MQKNIECIVITAPADPFQEVVFVTPPDAALPYVSAINFLLTAPDSVSYSLFRCPADQTLSRGAALAEIPEAFHEVTEVQLGPEPAPTPLSVRFQ
jgi:hypothetical protein